MKPKQATSDSVLQRLAGARYHAECALVTAHPTGTLNEKLADTLVEFVETEEEIGGETFHRFTDMSGLDRIDLSLNHVFETARRRKKGYRGKPVKSAFYAVRLISITIARMYQELMQESIIKVGVFRDRAAAAAWLEVPELILLPPKTS